MVALAPVSLLIVGRVLSLTVIFWVQLAVFPQASVAVQVRVITLLHDDPCLLCDSPGTTGTVSPHAFVAVTVGAAVTSP